MANIRVSFRVPCPALAKVQKVVRGQQRYVEEQSK